LKRIDRDWPVARQTGDEHLYWNWRTVCDKYEESLCLVSMSGEPAAIWTSRYGPRILPAGRFYRVDRLEVEPARKGKDFGRFLFSVIATRALELGVDGIILAALPSTVGFYATLGGEQRLCDGWEAEPGLEPFVFSHPTLLELKEDIDGLILEEE
jgi:GNAT superfamily N-acetyltransferase